MTAFRPGGAYKEQLDVRFAGEPPGWIRPVVEGHPSNADCWLIVIPRRGGKTWLARALAAARPNGTTQIVDLRREGSARAAGLECLLDPAVPVADPAELVVVDEPAIGDLGVHPEVLAAGLVRLKNAGGQPVVFVTPREHHLLMPLLPPDAAKDVVFPPSLKPEEVERMAQRTAWAPAVVADIRESDPRWLQNPFLLEVALHAAEDDATLRGDVTRLLTVARAAADADNYLPQVFDNGLDATQRAALRAARWKEAGVEIACSSTTTLLQKTRVLTDPVVTAHAPAVLRIHHVSDLHVGGTLRPTVDAKDKTLAGQRLADLAGAGTPLETYLNHLEQLANKGRAPHLLLVTGDLVNQPHDEYGREALRWLETATSYLADHEDLREDDPRVLLVEGNHDVSWDLVLDADSAARHQWFATTFAGYVHPEVNLPVAERGTWVEYPGSGLRIALLGSAESGGEFARDEDRKSYEEKVRQLASGGPDEIDALMKNVDRFDPRVVRREILDRMTPEDGFVTLAVIHHQVSPVPTVEVAPYSGIVNSGQTKRALAAAKTALVLHGHTHVSFLAAERFMDGPSAWTLRIAGAPTLASASAAEQNGYNEVFIRREGGLHTVVVRPVRFDGGQWLPQTEVAFVPGAAAESPLEALLDD